MMVSAENDPAPGRHHLDFQILDEPVPLVMPLVPVRVSNRARPDLAHGSRFERWTVSLPREFLKRFENGRRCYIAQVEDQIAAYGWVSLDDEHIGELMLPHSDCPVRSTSGIARPSLCFVRRHLYSELLGYIIEELHAEGLCHAWMRADLNNKPSQQGIGAGWLSSCRGPGSGSRFGNATGLGAGTTRCARANRRRGTPRISK